MDSRRREFEVNPELIAVHDTRRLQNCRFQPPYATAFLTCRMIIFASVPARVMLRPYKVWALVSAKGVVAHTLCSSKTANTSYGDNVTVDGCGRLQTAATAQNRGTTGIDRCWTGASYPRRSRLAHCYFYCGYCGCLICLNACKCTV